MGKTLSILAIEPYYGGSHRAFLDGWVESSRHKWTILDLPPYKWHWRMRHGAIHFAKQVATLLSEGKRWDLLFCSDMLNLAEFVGLAPHEIKGLPKVVYFHENQLTYPLPEKQDKRDFQYVITNMTTALAANEVWFNSTYHRQEFLEALTRFVKRMPDFKPIDEVDIIDLKSRIHPPGIVEQNPPTRDAGEPLHIVWAARWEHDKNPEDFFAALRLVKDAGIRFDLSVIGEQFRSSPDCFEKAAVEFDNEIVNWGYQESRDAYWNVLAAADVFVSTANHEFFGIGAVEAAAAGAIPVLPERLAYPEVFRKKEDGVTDAFFYDGTVSGLADKLIEVLSRCTEVERDQMKDHAVSIGKRYFWSSLVPDMDRALVDLCIG